MQVQKSYPQELLNLLKKLFKYLYHSNWETRIAASQAVEAILKNVPQWRIQSGVKMEEEEEEEESQMSLASFDIKHLLENGQFLMSSEGKEFDTEKTKDVDNASKIDQQRQQLNQQFGFDKLGLKSEQFIDDEDLHDNVSETGGDKKKSASEILSDEIKSIGGGHENLSAREMNRLKRKAKLDAKASKKAEEEAENEPKKMKLDPAVIKSELNGNGDDDITDKMIDLESSPKWPLRSFYDQLVSDIFSPRWERRHGAASALRELIKKHGDSGGREQGVCQEENDRRHGLWLEDLLVRLLSVLALDRFGDFVGDSVVCPVRESIGQVMGVVLARVQVSTLPALANIVADIMDNSEWHTRHAAMIIVKYVLSVDTGVGDQLVSSLFPMIVQGLNDDNDDVVSVAATSLLPVCHIVTSSLTSEVSSLTSALWDHTQHMDDLTSSTHSIMALLAKLLSHQQSPSSDLSSLVPRLYPFMSHNSSQVRQATLSCLLTLSSHDQVSVSWLGSCCQDIMSHLYTRALLEYNPTNLSLIEQVWTSICHNTPLQPLLMATCPLFSHWLQLISGPASSPLPLNPGGGSSRASQYLGGPDAQPLTDPHEKARVVWRARETGARMLGKLSAFIVEPLPDIVYTDIMETPLQMFLGKVLIPQLATSSAYTQVGVSMLILHWLDHALAPPQLGVSALPSTLLAGLAQKQNYSEVASLLAKLASEATDYVSSLKHFKLDLDSVFPTGNIVYTCDNVQQLVGPISDHLLANAKLKSKTLETIQQRRQGVRSTLEVAFEEQTNLELLTLSSLAGAVAFIGHEALPDKLNPVIKPVMEALKRQSSEDIQKTAARSLVRILKSCITRESSPNDKVVKNLCAFVCSNPEVTPIISLEHIQGQVHQTDGILTLYYNERNAEKATSNKNKRAKKPVVGSKTLSTVAPLQGTTDIDNEEDVKKVEIQRRGANLAVKELAEYFGHSLPDCMPKLWEICFTTILQSEQISEADPQSLVNSLSVLGIVIPSLSSLLHPQLLQLVPTLLRLTSHQLTAVRYMTAVTLAQLANHLTLDTMTAVVEQLVPQLEHPSCDLNTRQGIMETIYCLSEQLQLSLVPYIVLLVVPVLGSMSDPDTHVRLLATNTFATLVRLMPLDGGVPEPENLSLELKQKKEIEKQFLSQLLDSKTAASFTMPVPVNAELRSYQVAGVNWLAFLNKYKLHGILCDDMGLGKTLQSICMLASDHKNLAERGINAQSIVVCPTTLGGHWLEEVTKFVSIQYLNPFLYFGSPSQRSGLRSRVAHHNLIITSYEIVRSDVDFLGSIKWNYLFLDEGHVIKNTKTKTALAIRQLVASHRVILTGTPIQNGVNELWALFDFLMPGYLGTEKQFTAKYSRPIINSRDAKSSGKEQEAGALAMEALHRQTLPFILRRVKEDVLSDLPPKITQDYYCELSPVQTELYEDFARSQAQAGQDNSSTNPTHVFQALQYLKKVCNHPRLVLTKDHPSYEPVLNNYLEGNVENLMNINHAAKLTALKQLLTDLGIAVNHDNDQDTNTPVVSQHRALIFCQLKTMLDIVESDLLKNHLPSVTYLRLDGSVPANLRHSIVSKFNNDPSIDLLLLSTSVGGLGLNLTGADTVIFVEHDWNPMKDLQAMDRAHRIGQKKVVNVYRLITRNTLEEKIMSLQQFKIHTAKSVISDENSSMASMQTDQVNIFVIYIFHCNNGIFYSGFGFILAITRVKHRRSEV